MEVSREQTASHTAETVREPDRHDALGANRNTDPISRPGNGMQDATTRDESRSTVNGDPATTPAWRPGNATQGTTTPDESRRAASGTAATTPMSGTDERLLPDDALSDFQVRWETVQASFVDDPRAAVRDAEALVNDMVDRLTEVFTKERRSLEEVWSRGDQASTEDLRVALQRYRSFFGRLLAA